MSSSFDNEAGYAPLTLTYYSQASINNKAYAAVLSFKCTCLEHCCLQKCTLYTQVAPSAGFLKKKERKSVWLRMPDERGTTHTHAQSFHTWLLLVGGGGGGRFQFSQVHGLSQGAGSYTTGNCEDDDDHHTARLKSFCGVAGDEAWVSRKHTNTHAHVQQQTCSRSCLSTSHTRVALDEWRPAMHEKNPSLLKNRPGSLLHFQVSGCHTKINAGHKKTVGGWVAERHALQASFLQCAFSAQWMHSINKVRMRHYWATVWSGTVHGSICAKKNPGRKWRNIISKAIRASNLRPEKFVFSLTAHQPTCTVHKAYTWHETSTLGVAAYTWKYTLHTPANLGVADEDTRHAKQRQAFGETSPVYKSDTWPLASTCTVNASWSRLIKQIVGPDTWNEQLLTLSAGDA